MKRVMVTGAAGFIGSRVSSFLLEQGAEVTGVDCLNEAYDVRLKYHRLETLQSLPGFRFQKIDISDRAQLLPLFGNGVVFDAVINLAARAGVRPSVEDPWVYYETNLTGTLNLLQACVDSGVPKFVLASTSSLYGEADVPHLHEGLPTDRPISPYAASKKAAEVLAFTFHQLHGLDVTVFRYFTVYGPAGRPDMSLFRFVQWIREGRPVTIFGDGKQRRDFTYVDDVARGTLLGLEKVGYEIINLGSDQPIVLMDAVELVERLTGKRAQLEFRPRHQADVLSTWADVGKANSLLGWQAEWDFEAGVESLVDWYEVNRDWACRVQTGL